MAVRVLMCLSFDMIVTSNQQILGKYEIQYKIAKGTAVRIALILRDVIVLLDFPKSQ